MEQIKKIASFTVNHDMLREGVYISRIDGDITTYDLRTRVPNAGDYMDNLTMHSVEHMFATYIRSSEIGEQVVYFGPMGCQTGFYLLVRNADNDVVLRAILDTLDKIVNHKGRMFGAVKNECGNFRNLDLAAAKRECKRYLGILNNRENDFKYIDVDIAIIGAMESEINAIVAEMGDTIHERISGMDFYVGKIYGKSVVVARCGVGKVFASICAEIMAANYTPELLINMGVGGALASDLNTGDIVVASDLCQHDMDTSPVGDPVGLISGINKIYFESDKRASDIILKTAKEAGLNVRMGRIATGDQFVASKEAKDRIIKEFSADVCEMEGSAIAHVAYVNEIPFAAVRAISDSADGGATMDYPTFLPIATENLKKLTMALIKNW